MQTQVNSSIVAYVLKKVKPLAYFKALYEPEGVRVRDGGEWRIKCHWHDDSRPSLCINLDEGKFHCPACPSHSPTKGGSILAYERKLADNGIDEVEAAVRIYDKVVHPIVPFEKVIQYIKAYNDMPAAVAKMAQRLVSPEVVDRVGVGFDGSRLTFPVVNEFGLVTNLRRYDPVTKNGKVKRLKVINYDDPTRPGVSFGSPISIFGLPFIKDARDSKEKLLFITEGELDAMALNSICVPAVSSTGGAGSFPKHQLAEFRGLDVVFCYDNDTPGREGVAKAAKLIAGFAKSVRIIEVPEGKGKDPTDWIKVDEVMQDRNAWIRLALATPPSAENTVAVQATSDRDKVFKVALSHATDAKHFGRRIQVKGKVTGLDTTPFMIPKKVHASCAGECDTCPLAERGKTMIELEITPDDPGILKIVNAPEKAVNAYLLSRTGINPAAGCKGKVEVKEMQNVQGVLIGPMISVDEGKVDPVYAYTVGHRVEPNTAYFFEGRQYPAPKDQHSTLLLDSRWPAHDIISTFRLTPDIHERLKKLVVPDNTALRRVMAVAHYLAHVRAKIRGRDELAAAADLVFHSVSGFNFCGDFVRRGMLDVLILGDTRCGKTQVVRELVNFYRAGEIISGENCTFAGLVAGCHQVGDRWFTSWGALPSNHGRLVAIDEANNISHSLFSQLSRVRSEGLAEMDKIRRDRAPAMTRLMWIANPPKDAPSLSSYPTGVEAVKELIGAPEDIARFDFVVAVARDEVELTTINVVNPKAYDGEEFDDEALKLLILWTWTRAVDQVRFTVPAEMLANQLANTLAREYSSAIPLIQGENVRVKIARIAAAIAARCFSADESGEELIVRPGHVRAAVDFLRIMSNRPALGYDVFSAAKHGQENKADFVGVFEELVRLMPSVDLPFVKAQLFSSGVINSRVILDILSTDMLVAVSFLNKLMRSGCLVRIEDGRGNYRKTTGFTQWLRATNGTNLQKPK